jgi:hypothetical protein
MVRKTAARKTPATAKAVTRSKASVAAPAAKKSSEITPRRAVTTTAQKLRSPKVLVPLTVAVGVGVAAIAKLVRSSSGKGSTLPRLAKDLSPRFAEAVKALGDLGRELRAKVR